MPGCGTLTVQALPTKGQERGAWMVPAWEVTVGLTTSAVFTGPAQGAPSQYSSYQQGQGQQYGSYRASQTGPSAQQQRPYGYEQASFPGVSGSAICQVSNEAW